jgi:hypothetical protein
MRSPRYAEIWHKHKWQFGLEKADPTILAMRGFEFEEGWIDIVDDALTRIGEVVQATSFYD